MPKARWGGKGLFNSLHFTLWSITGGSQERAGTWMQELMQRPWRSTAYWIAPHDLLSLLSYTTQCHQPRDGTTLHGMRPATSNINQKITLQACLQANLMRALLKYSSISWGTSRLYQVDIKLTSTMTHIQFLGCTWWKEKNNSNKLTSGFLYACTSMCSHAHIHI